MCVHVCAQECTNEHVFRFARVSFLRTAVCLALLKQALFPHYDPGLANYAGLASQGGSMGLLFSTLCFLPTGFYYHCGHFMWDLQIKFTSLCLLGRHRGLSIPNLDYPFSGALKPLTSLCFFSLSQIYSIVSMQLHYFHGTPFSDIFRAFIFQINSSSVGK